MRARLTDLSTMRCVLCDADLTRSVTRSAFDPWLGRLWRVCASCRRWNPVPLEDRWERLEALERSARDRGRSIVRTDHLDLVDVGSTQLIRVGRAPRPELAGWRYGDVMPAAAARGFRAWLRGLLLGLPAHPFGYAAGHGDTFTDRSQVEHWFASPFLEDAPTLSAAFLYVPLAPECPACGRPLALEPWSFQAVRLTVDGGLPSVVSRCGLCDTEVVVPAAAARPALRLGLGVVNRRQSAREPVEAAARLVDRAGGPEGLLQRLTREDPALGELTIERRLALGFALDEQEEAELLEGEWREAEALARIADGELTEPAGFTEFRRRVLSGD